MGSLGLLMYSWPRTARVWTVRIHLYADFFFASNYYSATWSSVGWIRGFWTVDMEGLIDGFSTARRVSTPNPLPSPPHCSRLNCIWNYLSGSALLRNQPRLVLLVLLSFQEMMEDQSVSKPLDTSFKFSVLLGGLDVGDKEEQLRFGFNLSCHPSSWHAPHPHSTRDLKSEVLEP